MFSVKVGFIFILGPLICISSVNAKTENSDMVPFVVGYRATNPATGKVQVVPAGTAFENVWMYSGPGNPPATPTLEPIIKYVSLTAISSLLKSMRSSMCSVVRPGSVKVSVAIDADGKPLGIGVGAKGSIEVTLECPKS